MARDEEPQQKTPGTGTTSKKHHQHRHTDQQEQEQHPRAAAMKSSTEEERERQLCMKEWEEVASGQAPFTTMTTESGVTLRRQVARDLEEKGLQKPGNKKMTRTTN